MEKVKFSVLDLKNFYETNNRLPLLKHKGENSLYQWTVRERRKGNKEVIELLDSISAKVKKAYSMKDLYDFYKINNRLPKSKTKGERCLYEFMSAERRKGNEELNKFLESVGYVKASHYTFNDLLNFYRTHNRLPQSKINGECSLYRWMVRKLKESDKSVTEVITHA